MFCKGRRVENNYIVFISDIIQKFKGIRLESLVSVVFAKIETDILPGQSDG